MKRHFKLEFNPNIQFDIQHQVDYYYKETQSHELGKRFVKVVKKEFIRLKKHALQYEIKYDDVAYLFRNFLLEHIIEWTRKIIL